MAISILKKIIVPILLFHALSIAFFLNIDLPWDSFFQEPLRYAGDDGVYHMRLVENMLLGNNFPKSIFFDPFTYFPYGTYIHFAPLYDFLIAAVIWLISLGQPTLEIINKIAPFCPPVLSGLTVIVTYFIGKILWNKWTGLFSAFLMAISQPFLFRSLLGATDHHQAEVLFSSLSMMFLILALKNHDKKNFWLWTVLAGIGLGLYFLTWNGALLFLFIIFSFIVLYYLIEYLSGKQQNWLLAAGGLIFLIAFLMILPFANHPDILHASLYDIRHYGSLVLGMAGFLSVWLLGRFVKKSGLNFWTLPIMLGFLGFFFLSLIRIAFEPMFLAIMESFQATKIGAVGHELARMIINEMRPLTAKAAFEAFGYLFYLSFLSLGIIIYDFVKKRRPEKLLLAVWFLIIAAMTGVLIPAIGQGRFSYYFSINVSLFCGFLIVKGIRFAISGWRNSKDSPHKSYLRLGSILLLFNLVFFTFYPFPFNLTEDFPKNLPKIINGALQVGAFDVIQKHEDWYETLEWVKNNTPDPGLDYYAYYEEPEFNSQTGKIDPYPYPETAYGVLATWDLGHMITYYGHRLPNANPFQQGLGMAGEVTEPGETTFFIETEEERATEFLQELKTRYVITDHTSAGAEEGFYYKKLWANKESSSSAEEYYQSMIFRLHFLDGRQKQHSVQEETEQTFHIKQLDHFRLVYESKTLMAPSLFDEEKDGLENNVTMTKVFEYVEGAEIRGTAPQGATVEISTKITTNRGREFVYEQHPEVKDGAFAATVPYSTFGKDGWLENGTKFGVFAAPYVVRINGIERTINISEEDVLEGKEININP
jgi:dolichyl-diphosphooligosaccharide--protein glycosyltransferase